jgi:hypothetical protein
MRRIVLLLAFAAAARAAGPLAIVNTAVEQGEGGAPVPASFEAVSGEVLYFSFQVAGYQVAPDQKIKLRYKLEAFDPRGVRIIAVVEGRVDAELAPQDKEWRPKVRHELPIPPLAPPGKYKIAVEVTDELAKTTAAREHTLLVRGREVAPSETLVIRNFRFFGSEDATEPLRKAAYRPGESVWARFDIVGYKYGPGNKVDLNYGVAVLNAEGKQLWAQEEAAVERSESFYPKPFVPGSMSLNLQPNIRPGEYAIVITARDAVGGQTAEARGVFAVE